MTEQMARREPGGVKETRTFLVGLDLGQTNDYTALVILERVQKTITELVSEGRHGYAESTEQDAAYHLRYIERMRGMDSYAIRDQVKVLLAESEIEDNHTLVMDRSGMGWGVYDVFEKAGLKPIGVTIRPGDAVKRVSNTKWDVAKLELVTTLQVILQAKAPARMTYAKDLVGLDVLKIELEAFGSRITRAGNETFSAREGAHDDLITAMELACWYGECKAARPGRAYAGMY